ncbi:hypothetical protein K9M79_01460 [Candidatus Woesearchaeota archaeon]|nr:hypothetical protein [Candidatus Woesearchaeota archaeon]
MELNEIVKTLYLFELIMFGFGALSLFVGYIVNQAQFNYIGIGFIVFGMLMSFMEKRKK